jgi:hypothetical protein
VGFLDRAKRLLLPPAERRLLDAEAEAWSGEPKPSTALAVRTQAGAMGPPQGPPKNPPIDWRQDQPRPPPQRYTFAPGYSDHVYSQFSAPLGFEGFGLDRVRTAVAAHRLGTFIETNALCVAVLGFAPVLAALQQRVAPILALARHVHGGDQGLAKLVASEVEEMLVPRGGLLPSPYLQPTLWGTLGAQLALMNFAILQHVDGDPHPVTRVRPRYTRLWPSWACTMYRSPRKTIAFTTEGPVEVCDDGKFTLVADEEEPHLASPILALGEESLAGRLTQEQRLSWQDFFGKPKLWAELPPKVATHGGGGGDAFNAAFEIFYGPDGRGVLPNGAKIGAVSISGEGSDAFSASLLDSLVHIFMVLTGSAGTIGNGMNTGVTYQPAKSGAWNVRHDLYARDTLTIVRALNQGHVAPYCDHNYGDAIDAARLAGEWKAPVLEVPIPAPDRDERIASEIARYKALTDQVMAERAAGGVVDQARVEKLASVLEVQSFTLADAQPKGGEIFAYHYDNKLIAPDEGRERLGLPPLPNGAGSVERLAEERLAGGDKPGVLAPTASKPPTPAAPTEPARSAEDAEPTTQRSTRPAP